MEESLNVQVGVRKGLQHRIREGVSPRCMSPRVGTRTAWPFSMETVSKRSRHGRALGLLLGLVSGLVCAANPPQPAGGTQAFVVPIESVLRQLLPFDWERIGAFYETRQGRYLWHDEAGINEQGRQLYHWLAAAGRDGLDPADYHVIQLRPLMDDPLPAHRLLRELLLTDGYDRLARDLNAGRFDPQRADPLWQLQDDTIEPLSALDEALHRSDLQRLLDSLAPASDAYRRLREALARYRAIQSAGGWPALEIDHTLRSGDDDPAVVLLRTRLDAESGGQLAAAPDPTRFDADLQAAVERQQQRYGLKADGVVGPDTLRALNVPLETRIAQILASMERWRWLPRNLAPEYLMVNTAGFEIELVEQDQVRFHKRTVNGSQVRQTPAFISRVTHLVANPTWTVPRTIAVEDILPRLQAGEDYLQRNRIRVYRRDGDDWGAVDPAGIDWSLYNKNHFPFVLRQDPGDGNSLGHVKFYMPNPYAVFLHDTPAIGLFQRANRALSSGCVRVEGAEQLARLLARDTAAGQGADFIRALESGRTLVTSLERPIPVYLTYFTSWVDMSGAVNFRPDVYRRDDRLMLALSSGAVPMTAHRAVEVPASPL
jgi:L,D-transpeptidase YcbB